MGIAPAVLAAIFIVLGVVFCRGKGAFLIAGYNTSAKSEREQYDERALCRFMGRSMFVLAACQLIGVTSAFFDSMIPFWIGIALTLIVVFVMIVYANTGNRFKKK